jgi:glycosyltransferase involved in cell wall biosynthesis
MSLVDPDWVRALDRPLRHPVPGAGSTAAAELPAATALMALTWQMQPAGQRQGKSLDDPAARQRFMGRFFEAVERAKPLQALVASRWRAWLLQELPSPRSGAPAPTRSASMGVPMGDWLRRGPPAEAEAEPELTGAGHRQPQAASGASPSVLPSAVQNAASDATPRWRARPFGVNLFGFAFGELGIGEDVRMAAQACEAAQIPYRVVNVNPGSQLRQGDRALESQVEGSVAEAPYAVNLFCMPGFDMVGRVVMRDGPGVLADHYNIGWWPWELPVWPRRWASAFELVDEVWAATGFTQSMYAAATARPVTLMPLPATVERLVPTPRRELGLPARKFLFLFIFDFNSHLPRKNPWAVVAAFQAAFAPSDRTVGLVLKTMNTRADDAQWQAFKTLCSQDKRISLMEQTLDRGAVLGLVQACDAYVSLHRAEGFGRTLAEAMLLGKPVVATDFSGNVDFLSSRTGFPVAWQRQLLAPGDYPFVEADDAAWWAEPEVGDAARQLIAARAAAAEPAFAPRVLRYARKQFAPDRIGALMRQRLEAVWDQK